MHHKDMLLYHAMPRQAQAVGPGPGGPAKPKRLGQAQATHIVCGGNDVGKEALSRQLGLDAPAGEQGWGGVGGVRGEGRGGVRR
jgi:hypothetical protein